MTVARQVCILSLVGLAIQSTRERAERPKGEQLAGIITTKDVVSNVGLIWREFGLSCLLRCAAALAVAAVTGRSTTFLAVVMGGR